MTDAGRAVTERLVGVGVRAELRGACGGRHFFYITRGHDVGAAGVAVRLARIRHQGWRERGIWGAGWAEVVDSGFKVS